MLPLRGALALVLPLSLALAACGDADGPAGPDRTGEWLTQRLAAEVGADQAPLLATDGDDALVLAVSEDGVVTSHLSTDGAPFRAGEPLATGIEFVQLGGMVALPGGGWFTLGSGGMAEVGGDEEFVYDPIALRSGDGLRWERVAVDGFAQPVEVNDLTVVDDRIVVAGAYRTAPNPSMGGFEARLWTSTDAASFTEATPPGPPSARPQHHESYAGALAVSGGRVLAAGRMDQQATVWTSDDAARTWQRVADPVLAETYDLSGLAVVGDTVLAGAGEASVTALRSTDQGTTWTPVDALPAAGEDSSWGTVWADRNRFWTLTGLDDTTWSAPEVCYADLDQCGQSPGPRYVASADGSEWTAMTLPDEPEQITGTADGRVLVLSVTRAGLAVHTLPAGTPPPEAPEPEQPRTVELVRLAEGELPEVGVRYAAPMGLHCGMDWFWFGEDTWRRTDDGPDLESGAGDEAPDGWPVVGQVLYGHATLTDADHLEYAAGAEVITYRRAAGASGCL